MKKNSKLKKYTELFNKNIDSYLAKNVSVKTTVYPVDGPGAIFEFIFNQDNDNSEKIEKPKQSIGKVLSSIPQRFVGGNIDNVTFGGTNIFMDGNRLLLIKGEDSPEQWSGESISDDVRRVVSTSQGGK
jgi:hypothetical protein